MELSNKLGPIIAIGMGVIATVWLLSGEHGIVQAQDDTASGSPPSTVVDTSNDTADSKPLFKVSASALQAQWVQQTLRLSGYTIANNTLQINNRLAGRVIEVLINKGQSVKAGQPLIKIDDRTLQANLNQARALVKQRTLELEGVTRLTGQKLASQVSVASAEAALASAQASLSSLEVDLENSLIKAPFGGVVNEFTIKQNQWLSVGEQVATLVDTTPMKVAVQLPQHYMSSIQLNAPVDITIQGLELPGKISYISHIADSQTRSIPLEITLTESTKMVPTDISAEVILHLNKIKAHAVSPALLSINDNGQMSIKTLSQNTVKQQPVSVVRSEQDKVWITGLDDNTIVITSGQGFVKVGEQVDAEVISGAQP